MNVNKPVFFLVLAGSLVVNILLITYVGVSHIRQQIAASTQPATTKYPPALRKAYRNALRDDVMPLFSLARQIRAHRKRQAAFATAPEFDAEAFIENQAKLRAAQMDMLEVLHAALPEALSKMTPEDRLALQKADLKFHQDDMPENPDQ